MVEATVDAPAGEALWDARDVARYVKGSVSWVYKAAEAGLLPVATVELKNPLTAQNVQHAIEQYKTDRDPKLPIFRFQERSLVHFAVDPDVAYPATRSSAPSTASPRRSLPAAGEAANA